MTTGNAITINVNNVVIDLNSRKLGRGSAGAGTLATGIYAYQRKNITIKNGTVRGFYRGIRCMNESPFTTSQGHVVEDVRADMNTYIGILLMVVEASSETIRWWIRADPRYSAPERDLCSGSRGQGDQQRCLRDMRRREAPLMDSC